MQAPTGFWDPAGFTADGSVENFKRRRQTELKHGRISMLATMGYITPETCFCVLITFYTKMFFLCVSIQYYEIFFIRSEFWFTLCTLSRTHLCFYRWITHHFFFTSLEQIQGDHRQIPWILEPKCRLEVRRRPQRTSSHFQSASSGLGPNLGLHGLLRGFPRSVCWNSCCCRRLWLQGLDCV